MKKSTFVAMILGTIGTVLFALGMCMSLLPQWEASTEGRIVGVAGMAVLLVTVLVWRKMEHKAPIHWSGKTMGTVLLVVFGALLLGVGMCLTMVWNHYLAGIVIGLIGIVALLCLIPLVKGIK